MPTLPAANRKASKERRQDILAAALHCFITNGVEATSIEDIRTWSGASVGSIYHHFGSKEKLAAALYLDALADFQEGLFQKLAEHADAETDIRAIVAYHLEWVSDNADRARFLLSTRDAEFMIEAEEALQEMNQRYASELAAWRQPYVEAGVIRQLPEDMYRPLLVGPLHEFSRQWLAGRGDATMKEAERVLADAVWQALRAT